MKLIKLILLLFPITSWSQADTISDYIKASNLRYYGGTNWYLNYSTETKKGTVETPVQVMDSGLKIEVVETRDTIYKCPYNHITYFNAHGEVAQEKSYSNCDKQKVITTRRYKLYVINEYGQKEYLSMELTKTK